MTEVSNLSNSTNTSSINFSEILKLLDDLPIVDLESTKTAQKHENKKAVSVGSFGRLDEIISWLSLWQGKYPPRISSAAGLVGRFVSIRYITGGP